MEYTKEYEYDEKIIEDPRKTGRLPGVTSGAFSYDKSPTSESISSPESYDKSPGIRKAKGRAFNYAPGDLDKVAEEADKRKKALQDMSLGQGEVSLDIDRPPVQTSTPASTFITTPEKDKGFDVENFGNENKFLSDSMKQQQQPQQYLLQQQDLAGSKLPQEQLGTSPHLYGPRPWSAASSVSGSSYRPGDTSSILAYNRGDSGAVSPVDSDRKTPRGGRASSSIFSQPGYTTSFLNKPVSPSSGSESGIGYQNRVFQESPNPTRPMSTSTPLTGIPTTLGSRGDTFSYATPARPFPQSESMITHPGTVGSQAYEPSREDDLSDIQQQNTTGESLASMSSSESEDDSLHSSSSSDYEENKVPSTDELQEPADLRRRGSSRRKKGKKSSFKGALSTTPQIASVTPKIVKTTTKQMVVKDAGGIRQDVHERVEDLTPGGSGIVTVSTTTNQVGIL